MSATSPSTQMDTSIWSAQPSHRTFPPRMHCGRRTSVVNARISSLAATPSSRGSHRTEARLCTPHTSVGRSTTMHSLSRWTPAATPTSPDIPDRQTSRFQTVPRSGSWLAVNPTSSSQNLARREPFCTRRISVAEGPFGTLAIRSRLMDLDPHTSRPDVVRGLPPHVWCFPEDVHHR